MSAQARTIALELLERSRRQGAFSDSVLQSALDSGALIPRDKALVTRLFYGVIQNTILLDFYIDNFVNNRKLEPKLRDILRLSLYQILFLDKIPDHAAVNEAVELCKLAGLGRASGLVNAALRRAVNSREMLPPIPGENILAYLSVKYSTPKALVAEFLAEFGEDFTEKLLQANNADTPVTLQVNTLKTSAEELVRLLEANGIMAEPHPFLTDALNVPANGAALYSSPAFEKGLFYVQDAAAALAVKACGLSPGARVLDACAAPGGKSFACAIAMENRGEVLSCDIHSNKLGRVERGAKLLGTDIVTTRLLDASKPCDELIEAFDLVLADLPCSGLGIIRKKPDIRFKAPQDLKRLPQVQLGILENVSGYVKPGGVLLYSTCTIMRRENEDVVTAFLEKHPEFSAEAFSLPEPIGEAGDGMKTLYPHIHNTDGFFICKLRKNK
jgi:16S rRNA (cytosine967-C5)-methyltransferase